MRDEQTKGPPSAELEESTEKVNASRNRSVEIQAPIGSKTALFPSMALDSGAAVYCAAIRDDCRADTCCNTACILTQAS